MALPKEREQQEETENLMTAENQTEMNDVTEKENQVATENLTEIENQTENQTAIAEKSLKENKITYVIPLLNAKNMAILPGMVIHFDLSQPSSIAAVRAAMTDSARILIANQLDPNAEEPGFRDFYEIGTIALIKQVTKLPDESVRILIEGLQRVSLQSFPATEPYVLAEVCPIPDEEGGIDPLRRDAMLRSLKELFATYASFYEKIGQAISRQVEECPALAGLIDLITVNIPLPFVQKQEVLSACDLEKRWEVLSEILEREVEVAQIRDEMSAEVKNRVDKNQRDYILREHLQYLEEELGDKGPAGEAEEYRERLDKLKASKEVKEKISKEIDRFEAVAGSTSELALERTYLDTVLDLPWDMTSKDSNDLDRAERILNEDHYGLTKVKERILEYLAVRVMTKKGESPILCLVGPPGTGKTSIAQSIARALHKKYVRVCLGGVRDEAEIRGHRKTYIGAMPGRIAEGMSQAGVKNPLMLLDEIDKAGTDARGDTASALLEVLDSEQNSHFRDHYIEIPMDLSQVLFIATANTTDGIPRALLDRMEIVELNSYTAKEKFHIAKEHLVDKQLAKNGMEGRLQISDGALRIMIDSYTREAGVRNLEREIGALCRKAARELLQKNKEKEQVKVTAANLAHYLGYPMYDRDLPDGKNAVGIAQGLAWTAVGGEMLQIEVSLFPGKGEIELTGQMGDVMRESALIAMSYVRSVADKYKITHDIFKEKDFHIHIPEGAVPKDGPSAGVTMAAAILSAVTKRALYGRVAMTGEITLRGRVLPVGGLQEKILAAQTAGMERVLVPKRNEKDILEIPDEIKAGLQISYIETMEDVIQYSMSKKKS